MLSLGSLELLRIPQTRICKSWASSVGSFRAASSIPAMVSCNGKLVGTGAKLRPFFNTSSWSEVRARLDRLTTQRACPSGRSSAFFLLLLRSVPSFHHHGAGGVTRLANGKLDITVYRKKTHTDRYLHFESSELHLLSMSQ